MTDYIEINIPSLRSDVDEMRAELIRIRDDMKKMFEAMQALDTMWDGPANRAFQLQFSGDYELMEDMCQTIDSLIAYGENAEKEYTNCENAVATAIAEI